MKVVDANILLDAVNVRAAQHEPARAWLDRSLAGEEAVGFSWLVLIAFLRLGTNPAIFPRPLSLDQAGTIVEAWLAQRAAVVLHPTPRHLAVLRGLLAPIGTAGNLVSDAHLAALAIEHGAEVISFDRDFGRFPGLRWSLPAPE